MVSIGIVADENKISHHRDAYKVGANVRTSRVSMTSSPMLIRERWL